MKKELLLLSVIEGSAVMIAELCGARLLAPVFGSSLYVWASVMGITLAALAAGYFVGGSATNTKKSTLQQLGTLLGYSALALCAMPLFSHWMLPLFSILPFKLGVLVSTTFVLVPPVFLLGCTSPLFIEAQVQDGKNAGKVSGTVYAVSTMGGIAATFLAGFWLIPMLGLQFTLLSIALLLFVASIFILRIKNYTIYALFVLCLVLHLKLYLNRAAMLYSKDGILGQVSVIEKNEDGKTKRLLLVNKIIQTEIDVATQKTDAVYLQLFDSLISATDMPKTAVVLGLGGGKNAANLVNKGYNTMAVEFDERIAEVAQQYFFLPKEVKVVVQDARYFIANTTSKFDIIIADLYKAEEQPAHLFTVESLLAIKQTLNAGGTFFISWHGYLQGERGKGTRVLLNSLLAAGYKLRLHAKSNDEDTRNLIIEAVNNTFGATSNKYLVAMPRLAEEALNTDDNLCLEKYNAAANESWRKLYLAYYQNTAGF